MTEVGKMPQMSKFSSDDFQTPPEALSPLLPYLNKKWIIWECADGHGNLTKAFGKLGYKVIGTDILTGENFLTWTPDRYDVIVTNPPYSQKQEFLERAYQLGKPFAFLLPLTTLETPKRQSLFDDHGIEIILFDKRIHFETPNKNESKSWFQTAWFTNGLNIGKQLSFVKLNKGESMSITALAKKINEKIAGIKTYRVRTVTGPGHIISWSNQSRSWGYHGFLPRGKSYPLGPDYFLISESWSTKRDMPKACKLLKPLPLFKRSFESAPVSAAIYQDIKRDKVKRLPGKIVTLPKRGKFIHEYHSSSKDWDTVRSILTDGHVLRIGYSDLDPKT